VSRSWIAVASAEHVRLGREAGFMQVGHGKIAPLRRIHQGDRLAYYSPTEALGGKDRFQAFTAIGIVAAGEPYQIAMAGGFRPFRRGVRWLAAHETPIRDLLDELALTKGKRHWGSQFRFGLVAIGDSDFDVIAAAMGARIPPPA
jgi:hypothetical protein